MPEKPLKLRHFIVKSHYYPSTQFHACFPTCNKMGYMFTACELYISFECLCGVVRRTPCPVYWKWHVTLFTESNRRICLILRLKKFLSEPHIHNKRETTRCADWDTVLFRPHVQYAISCAVRHKRETRRPFILRTKRRRSWYQTSKPNVTSEQKSAQIHFFRRSQLKM